MTVLTHEAPEGFGGAELAGEELDGDDPAGADDECDADADVGDVAGFFVEDVVGRGVDVAVADEDPGMVAMMGAT